MYKKLISLLLAALFVLSLCACSSESSSGSKGSGVAAVEAQSKKKPSSGSTAASEVPSSADLPEADVLRPVHVEIGSCTRSSRDMSSYALYYSQEWYTLYLDEESSAEFPELAGALVVWTADAMSAADFRYQENERWAYETYEELSPYYEDIYCYDSYSAAVMRADSHYLSVRSDYESYSGGAHGYYACFGTTWDSRTGDLLEAQDVFSDLGALSDALRMLVTEEYPSVAEFSADLMDSYFSGVVTGETSVNFCLGNEGAVFWFNPYEIGCYADGMQQVTLSYADWPSLFKIDCADCTGNYIVPLTSAACELTDVNGDGMKDVIWPYEEYVDGDYWYRYGFSVNGDIICPEGAEGYSAKYYLVRYQGHTYLYLFVTSDNDYINLYVADPVSGSCATGGNLYIPAVFSDYDDELGYYSHVVRSFSDPESMILGSRLYTLGTYSGIRTYTPDAGGVPSCASGTPYEINSTFDLVSTAAFGGTLIGSAGDYLADLSALSLTGRTASGDSVRVDIPAGSTMRVIGTDNSGYVALQLSDGRCVACVMNHDSWPWMLDNREEDALFEMLPYAG